MKIAIYTICKDEEKHVERFMAGIKDEVDEIHVTDTGSSDKTVQALRDCGATVHSTLVNPWRFDVPRNTSLAFVPADVDVCVCIDLDEVFDPGWRAAIEAAWTPDTTRLKYQYAWSHNPDGSPALTFWYDKIHQRHDYRWIKPVHEILTRASCAEVQTYANDIMLHHWPDSSKSRGSYLGLLELACREEPDDDRSAHYLGREYSFYSQHEQAIKELTRHLALPRAQWKPERAASMRILSKAYKALGDWDKGYSWVMQACVEAPAEREPWVDLAQFSYERHDWILTYAAAKKATAISERPLTYICEPQAWGSHPWDLLSFSAWQLGHKQEALAAAVKAVELSKGDARLQANLETIRREVDNIKLG